MENGYRRLLEGFLKIRWFAWVIIAVCVVIIVFTSNNLKSELAPLEDQQFHSFYGYRAGRYELQLYVEYFRQHCQLSV